MIQAPKVTLFNAQDASIEDLVQRPFVVSVTEPELRPIVRVVQEGLKIRVRPVLHGTGDQITVDCDLLHQQIDDVDEITFRHSGADGVTLQVPRVTRQCLVVNDLKMPVNSTLLVAGLQTHVNEDKRITLAMIEFTPILKRTQVEIQPTSEQSTIA